MYVAWHAKLKRMFYENWILQHIFASWNRWKQEAFREGIHLIVFDLNLWTEPVRWATILWNLHQNLCISSAILFSDKTHWWTDKHTNDCNENITPPQNSLIWEFMKFWFLKNINTFFVDQSYIFETHFHILWSQWERTFGRKVNMLLKKMKNKSTIVFFFKIYDFVVIEKCLFELPKMWQDNCLHVS